jgi:UDP-glucose 4-epimerase
MGKILVTGGAGYVGSHIVRMLVDGGREVVVLDDLSLGHRAAVGQVPLVVSDFADRATLDDLLGRGGVEWIVHMAASCEVGESVADPAKYYANNVTRSLGLLDAAVAHGVRGVVFSSSAAVYGEPEALPIDEEQPTRPTNPYGETKLVFERALRWYHRAHGLRYVALRYFNAAGAHPDGTIGEDHSPESHIIPRLLGALKPGGESVPIFGTDYPTEDGTCVRDYVHVLDLAQAHRLAVEGMQDGRVAAESINLGNGAGFSVRQVVEMVEQVAGRRPPTEDAPRRPGDPARLVASHRRAVDLLGWRPAFDSLRDIVGTAWDWHREHPEGYGGRG